MAAARPTWAIITAGSRRARAQVIPAADTRVRSSTRSGSVIASSVAMKPPIELPTSEQRSTPSRSQKSRRNRPYVGIESCHCGMGLEPKPGRSRVMTRWVRAKCEMFSSQFCQAPERPWTKTSGGPLPIST
jgi:hypothetical protein